MKIEVDHFDLDMIRDSGQCFRMNKNLDGSFGLIHKGKYLEITSENNSSNEHTTLLLECNEREYEDIWRDYFDLGYDYTEYMCGIDSEDNFLRSAIQYGHGIRILKQDPWETLVSFIISQRKSIPAIRTSIEKLSCLCGNKIETAQGDFYSFPIASEVAKLSEAELASCSLGYRGKYISQLAKNVANESLDLYAIGDLEDNELLDFLLGIYGVGIKVARCTMLFGYHRLDSFPEDVWIKRALEHAYPEGFPYERYKGYNGVLQQYIFYYMRNYIGNK